MTKNPKVGCNFFQLQGLNLSTSYRVSYLSGLVEVNQPGPLVDYSTSFWYLYLCKHDRSELQVVRT
jgi:hypothetical protein